MVQPIEQQQQQKQKQEDEIDDINAKNANVVVVDIVQQQQQQQQVVPAPKVVSDPRYRAGRTLIRNGQAEAAITIFSTLLEEARTKFGDDHFETCPAYYEYGNSLFRLSNQKKIMFQEQQEQQEEEEEHQSQITIENDNESGGRGDGKDESTAIDRVSSISNPSIAKSEDIRSNDTMTRTATVATDDEDIFKKQMREKVAAAATRRVQQQNDSNNIDKQLQSQQNKEDCVPQSLYNSANHGIKIKEEDNDDDDMNDRKKPALIDIKSNASTGGNGPQSEHVATNHPEQQGIRDKVGSRGDVLSDVNDTSANSRNTTTTTTTGTTLTTPNTIDDDIQLALEMMENSWAIIDEYQQRGELDPINVLYKEWIQKEIPRILTGIGDIFSCMGRHADSADAYLRALGYRETMLEVNYGSNNNDNNNNNNNNNNKSKESVEYLTFRRLIVESNVLIAEELLSCPLNEDVVTTESKTVLVHVHSEKDNCTTTSSSSIVDYARGYYDKAREELQETVFLMGKLASLGIDIGNEKEDICFVATMVMGVGTTIAEIDEQELKQKQQHNKQQQGQKQIQQQGQQQEQQKQQHNNKNLYPDIHTTDITKKRKERK